MNSEGFRPIFMMDSQGNNSGLSLSLYFEQSDFTHLLALVKEFGALQVYKYGQDFVISLGTQRFLAASRLKEASLSLIEAQQFHPKDAKKFLALADLLFHDRKHPFKLIAPDTNDEFLIWAIARALNILIDSRNPEQGSRFQEWLFEEEQRKRLLFSQTHEDDAHPSETPGFQGNLHFHEATLIIETIEVMRILEIIASLDLVHIYYQGDNFVLELPDLSISVSEQFHKCNLYLGNISALSAGAAELIAKIIDLLFYDRKQRAFRFEITGNPKAEAALYQALLKLNIPLQALSPEQARRFQALKNTVLGNLSIFTQADKNTNDSPPTPTPPSPNR
jgi:hypothetical protein